MISLLIFLLVLSGLIIIHEFGHFIFARKSGVKVVRFSIGFGPVLYAYKGKATEYVLSLFPLGGYVKLAGDNIDEYKGQRDEFYAQPISKRFGIIFAGPLLNYILGCLCFGIIFYLGVPRFSTMVGGTLDGYGAQVAGIQAQDTVVAVLYFTNQISGTAAIILGLFAVIFLVTSFMAFCPLYVPFKISTKKEAS